MPRVAPLASRIRERLDTLATHLAALIHGEALRVVYRTLGGSDTAPARRGPGRPRATAKRRNPGRRSGRRQRARSTGAATVDLAPRVLAQVKAHPGQGVTEIAAALGTSSDAVKPAVAALLAAKEIRKTGQRRGTKYHAAGSGGGASPKKTKRKTSAAKAKGKATKTTGRKGRRKPRRASRAARKSVHPAPLPIKTISARRAPKLPTRSVERQEPGAVATVEAVVPAPEPATAKTSIAKEKGRRKKAAAAKSTAQELADAVASNR